MRKPVIEGWLVVLVGVALQARGVGPARAEEPQGVSVTVLAPDGSPVSGASTVVWQRGRRDGASEWTVAGGKTDPRGQVTLRGLDASLKYRLEVTPPPSRQDLALYDLGTWQPVGATVRLERGFTVSGVVRDPLGRSLKRVDVNVLARVRMSDGSWITEKGLSLSEEFSEGGAFKFEHLPLGRRVLRARRTDEKYDEHDVVIGVATPENPRIELWLAKDDESSRIVRRVEGWKGDWFAFLLETAEDGSPRARGESDAVLPSGVGLRNRGMFRVLPRLDVAEDGTFLLKPTFDAVTSTLWIPPESPESNLSLYIPEVGLFPADGPFRLVAGHTIRGKVKRGVPLGDTARVHALGPDAIAVRGTVRADGTFEIRGLPKGRWRVLGEVGDSIETRRRGSLDADTESEIELELK